MTWLIESPMPYLILGIIAVAILAIAFFNTGRAVFLLALGGAVLLTVAGVFIERAIVTEREEVESALYAMADAMEANDCNAALALLSPSNVHTRQRAQWAFSRFEVKKANISNLEIVVNKLTSPPSAKATFKGFIQVHDKKGDFSGSQLINFTIDYRKENGRWLLTGHKEEIGGLGTKPKKTR